MAFTGIKSIPKQRVPDSIKKTFKWQKDTIDAVEGLILHQNSTIRQSRYNKQINYDLVAGKMHPSDVERIMNPSKLKNAYFPAQVKNHPITNPYLKILIGEEFNRRFDFHIRVENEDAISEKEKAKKELVMKQLQEMLVASVQQPMNQSPEEQQRYEEEVQTQLQSLNNYVNYEWQDLRELSATQILNYYQQYLEMRIKFNRGWEDAIIAAEEIYCVDVISNEPFLRKCNPLNTYYLLSPDSYKVEDAEYIMEEQYLPISKVIDLYYDYLKDSDIDFLEQRTGYRATTYGSIPNYELTDPTFPVSQVSPELGYDYTNYGAASMLPFDTQNNVRVVKVVWRSMRRIGKLTFINQETGEQEEVIVPDGYKIDKESGEEIKWMWIGEWWEGTKVANDIYIKIQPRPVQFRQLNNISECKSGYIGSVYKTNSSQSQSIFDIMKPYQYMYNLYSYRTELAFIKSKGKIGSLDLARIPDGWEPDKWMYYAEVLGWAVEDSFKEAKKGAATGKIAGNMSGHAPVMDLELGNFIQQHISMLQYIESQLDKITGIGPQRRGAVGTAEQGLGVTLEAKQASSTITEWYFQMHDDVKRRVMEAVLETAKYCLRNKNKKFQYINDDMTQTIFTIDGELLNEAEYGLFIRSASEDSRTIGVLQRATEAAFQSGQVDIIQLMDIFSNTSLSSIRRKTEKAVKEKQDMAEKARQEENQIKQQQINVQQQIAAEQNALKKYEIDSNNQTKIAVAEIQVFNRQDNLDLDNNGIPDPIEVAELARKEQEYLSKNFTEQQKHEREVRKQDSDKAIKEKELNFKEKELQVKKEIEQLKAETALKVAKQNKNKYDSKSKK
jgi:hypothetical protein